MSRGTPSIPCHPPCQAVPSPVGSLHSPFSRASTFPHEVTGCGHMALAPWRALVGRLPCTPCHWELVARAGPMPPAPYRRHCSTVGTMPVAVRGHGTASPSGCGAWGTPILGRAGGTGLGLPWVGGPGCSPASSTPGVGGATRTTVAATSVPLLPPRGAMCGAGKLRHGRGGGDTPPLAPPGVWWLPQPGGCGLLPEHPLPSLWGCWAGGGRHNPGPAPLHLLPPSRDGGGGPRGGGKGRGGLPGRAGAGRGKEVGLWRRDPMSPKNVPRSQPF